MGRVTLVGMGVLLGASCGGRTPVLGNAHGEESPGPPDEPFETWSVRAEHFEIAPRETQYVCFELTAAVERLQHIIGFTPAIDNAAYVHHSSVRLLSEPSGNDPGYSCFNLDGDKLWGWTPGVSEYWFPPYVGRLVGETGTVTIRLQIHYNNPLLVEGEVDHSGIDIHYTDELRDHNGGSLSFADVRVISIPPGLEAYEHIADCPEQETRQGLLGPIHGFRAFVHAHELATAVWGEVHREDGSVEEFVKQAPYDFEDQAFEDTSISIEPGDRVETHCIYDSTERSEITKGGAGTTDEMCWSSVLFYPRENATFDYCGEL